MRSILLGIDVGTSSLKSAIYDQEGNSLATEAEAYQIFQAHRAWAEQDPDLWWSALAKTLAIALRRAKAKTRDLVSIGIDCFAPSLVPIDRKGRPLRNALTPMDVRSTEEVSEIADRLGADRVFEITGNRLATGTSSLPSILWIRKHEKKVWDKTWKFVHANGYLAYLLTGTCTMDWSNAALTLLYDQHRKCWSTEILDAFQIPVEKLPDLCSPKDVSGEVRTAQASRLGFRGGIPVAGGSIDTNCAALGAGVVKQGQAVDSGGAASCLGVVTDGPHFDDRFLNRVHAIPEKWIIVSQGPHSGLALRWFKDEFCKEESRISSRRHMDVYPILDEMASQSSPGANGTVFLPYFMGESSPTWNPLSTSVFFGVSPGQTKGDFIRAILEGTVFNIRENLEVLSELGVEVNELRFIGGQSRSRLWRKIRSDITGMKIVVPKVKDATSLGSAILGGVAAGVFTSPEEGATAICDVEETIQPDQENHERYNAFYRLYRQIYQDSMASFKTRASILGDL
jgi:xylulokinase